MLHLTIGLVVGILVGASAMYFKNIQNIRVVKSTLQEAQDKLKSVKSQLYKRRTSYKKKPNGSNGKKATRKKAVSDTKKTNI